MNTVPGPAMLLVLDISICVVGHTGEFADQSFARAQVTENPTTGNTLQDIIAIPCYEMAVVDDVLLARLELFTHLDSFQGSSGLDVDLRLSG